MIEMYVSYFIRIVNIIITRITRRRFTVSTRILLVIFDLKFPSALYIINLDVSFMSAFRRDIIYVPLRPSIFTDLYFN